MLFATRSNAQPPTPSGLRFPRMHPSRAGGRLTRIALAAIAALGLAACGDEAPQVPAEVVVTPGLTTAETVGQTVQFAAQVIDTEGKPIAGASVSWSSADLDVATVSASGLATVTGQGSATIRATHESVSGRASLVVDLRPANILRVAGDSLTAPVATALPERPTVQVVDAGGAPVPGEDVSFEVALGSGSVAPLRSRTDQDGQASTRWTLGEQRGVQRLRASSGSLETEFVATATGPPLSIETDQLRRARLELAYSASLESAYGEGEVTWSLVGGSLPQGLVLNADGTITGTAAARGSSAFIAMARDSAGSEARKELSIRVCPAPLKLAVGEVQSGTLLSADPCPPFFPAGEAGDRYRVAAVRLNFGFRPTLVDAAITVTEHGAPAGAARAGIAQASRGRRTLVTDPAVLETALPPSIEAAVRRADATSRFHGRLLEEAVRIRERLGRDRVLPDLRGARTDPAGTRAETQAPPPRITLLPYNNQSDLCTNAPPGAVALLVDHNAHLAVYQDSVQQSTNPVVTEDVRQVLDYYAAYGVQTIDDYFGRVPDINGDGRVTVFLSPAADDVAAFVWAGDYFSKSDCAASNEQELVYFNTEMFHSVGRAPNGGHYQALPTMVHELKHVTSLYQRLRATSGFHPTWVEEGTAEIAAEVSSRRAMEATGGVAAGEMFTRDAYPPRSGSIITPENYGVLLRLARTIVSYSKGENSLTTNVVDGHTYYGTSWHFHRFVGDAYGGAAELAEAPLFAALTDSLASSGIEGLEAVTGKTMAELMTEYATAMIFNGTGAPAPQRSFATYDFPSATFDLFRPDSNVRPAGLYPWPVTGPQPAPFDDAVFLGGMAPAGIRIYDFESDGHGDGIEVAVEVGGPASVVLTRIR